MISRITKEFGANPPTGRSSTRPNVALKKIAKEIILQGPIRLSLAFCHILFIAPARMPANNKGAIISDNVEFT